MFTDVRKRMPLCERAARTIGLPRADTSSILRMFPVCRHRQSTCTSRCDVVACPKNTGGIRAQTPGTRAHSLSLSSKHEARHYRLTTMSQRPLCAQLTAREKKGSSDGGLLQLWQLRGLPLRQAFLRRRRPGLEGLRRAKLHRHDAVAPLLRRFSAAATSLFLMLSASAFLLCFVSLASNACLSFLKSLMQLTSYDSSISAFASDQFMFTFAVAGTSGKGTLTF